MKGRNKLRMYTISDIPLGKQIINQPNLYT